jgi:hypothetical protein
MRIEITNYSALASGLCPVDPYPGASRVSEAADGYARMTGNPAATLLHLGPAMAKGLAKIHNANKASTPMVNIVGDHAG